MKSVLKRIFWSRFLWLYWFAAIILITMVWPLGGYLFLGATIAFAGGGIAVALIWRISVGVEETIKQWGRRR